MSDDRMDRAERIRNMRKGNRGTEEETADDDAASEATTGEHRDAPDDGAVGATSDQPAGTDDAAAAAQRAAAAASEVVGEGDVTADDGGEKAEATAGTAGGGTRMGQGPTGVELPDQQLLEEAMDHSAVQSTEGAARAAAMEGESTQAEELVRVLEFALGEEYYCLDIEYVEEIVKRDAVTRVPNTPDFVDGVVDLRGQITTILEPKEMMDIDTEGDQNLIIVFDPDQFEEQGAVGWVVDEVRQVVPVTETEVNSSPVDADYINGVVDRDEYDQFVIWVEPDDALAQATGGEEE